MRKANSIEISQGGSNTDSGAIIRVSYSNKEDNI